MFFDSWVSFGTTAVVGFLAYIALVFLLRISGKRTLSKMNAFDLIVTVALGSTLATVFVSSTVPLTRGVLAFALLILFQYTITWLSVRSPEFRRLVKAEPTLLFHRGEFLKGAMKQQRVTEEEIRASLRTQGVAGIESVEAVVLESDSGFSVVMKPAKGQKSSLTDVMGRN